LKSFIALVLAVFALVLANAGPSFADAGDAAPSPAAATADDTAPARPSPRPAVFVAKIDGMIDLGLGPFVERVLETAKAHPAGTVVLEINTFGGRVDAAVAIRDHLLRSEVPTIAFVNKRAISAGALITLAAEKVVMARGGTIGAATPVQMKEPDAPASPVDEKSLSYVRKEFRATADARERPGLIAEAMVDADVAIEGVIEKGKLLTLTTEGALLHGVADLEADDLPALLAALDLSGAELHPMKENWAERVVRFLTNPAVASLLMTIGLIGILVELRTPGLGVPGILGATSLAAFFWGHWLVQLVGWEQVLLVVGGLLLLAVEIFLLPGFGIAGVLGVLALAAGLSSSFVGAGATLGALAVALSYVVISAAVALVGGLLLMRYLPLLPGSRRLILGTALAGGGPQDLERPSLEGEVGTAVTALRPSGIASLGGLRVDVVSEGDFIQVGQAIVVVRDEGHRVVVKLRDQSSQKETSS
jgi:membrane-bound serine protease (ClpP class)